MTKRRHSMRNHKNLRLVIPDATADLENNSEIDTVVLQQPVRYLGNQEEDKQIDDEKKKADISRLQAGQSKNAPVGSSVSFINLLSTGFEKLLMAVGIISSIISGLALPVSVHIFGNLVGSMVSAEINAASSTTEPNVTKNLIMNAVTEFAIGNCVAGIVLMVFTYVGVMLFNYTALKQGFRLRTMLFRSVLHQDIAWYDSSKSGELACRLTEDVMKYEDGVGEKVSMLVHNLAAFIGSLVLAFVSGWKLTLVCLACVPVMALVFACIVRISSIFTRREVEVYAAAGSIAEEVLNGIRTVVAFAGQDKELLRYTDKLHLSYENNVKKGLLSGLGLGLLWLSMYASYAFAYWYGVTLVLEERGLPSNEQTYNPSSIVTVFFSIMTGVMSLATSSPFIEAFGAAKASADKIFTIIHRTPIINSLNNDGQKPTDIIGSIEFKNVSFEYPSRKGVNILKNLSFSVRRGQTVAIVGSSGCGKSTCIQLLQRFYDPIEGQILIDGYDLRDLNVKWLRSCLGTVGQEPVLFDTTVAQNIRFGDAEANIEKIIRAAKKANAHDFTTKLPYKYDTLVGEKGAKLSGGQKQRIAIARALIKRPIVLLLDEATSSLDTRCESKVQAALDKAHHGRTTIIVAHRLTTIKGADKIIVLSEGGVVEEGKHDELMELKGHYYSLVTAQVSCFRKKSAFVSKLDELDEDEESELARRKSKISVGEKKSSERKKKVSLLQIFKLNNKEWHLNAIACLASIISGFGTPLFSVLFGDFLGVLSLKNPNDVRDRSNIYCVYFIITGIVIGVTSFIQVFLFRIAGERLTMRLRGQTFAAMLRQEVGWYDMPVNGTGALCSKLSTEVAAVQGAIGQRIGTIIQSCSTIGLSVGLAMYYEWRLGLLGMAFIPLIMCVTYVQGRLFWRETLDYHTSLEASTKIAVEAVGNIRTVIGLCQEDTFYNSYINTMSPALKLGVRNTHFRGLVFGLARSCGYFAFAACMYYGGYLIENEGLFYADVFKVSQALILGTFTVANAFAFAPNLQKGLVAAEQIIHLLERKSKIQDPKSLTNDNWVSSANVNFEKVNFKFSSRPKTKVLKDFDLHIPNGMMIALIGASGCGKSTVIQLLERFYDPDSGEITISNTNVKSVAQLALRKQLGLVSQEPTLFARSIAENIAYGDNEREVPMDEIIEAAKMANIHNFVSSLPRGYETRLGNRGTQLSGGQKQRIAIARALVRNPKILLLDEATSALDSESEKIVQAALDEARVGRTCILIAHRLSTVKDADIICVIDRGTIAESGTHSELVEKRGLYYELLCLQN